MKMVHPRENVVLSFPASVIIRIELLCANGKHFDPIVVLREKGQQGFEKRSTGFANNTRILKLRLSLVMG